MSPARTFSILVFACPAASLSAPDIEYWIPETTNISTPTSAVMKVAYLMSPLKMSITLPKPGCMVHSYFCFVISPTISSNTIHTRNSFCYGNFCCSPSGWVSSSCRSHRISHSSRYYLQCGNNSSWTNQNSSYHS